MGEERKVAKVDYGEISKTYDLARRVDEDILDLWLNMIKEKVDEAYGPDAGRGRRISFLDDGGGTGRWALPIAERLGYSVTCADISRDMISKGVEKDVERLVRWEVQDAQRLSYADESFEVVFISHVLHHVDRPFDVIKEGYRVLKSGGIILNRHAPIEDITNDPDHTFFPETHEIDEARVPRRGEVEQWCLDAGFRDITTEKVTQKTWKTAEERLRRTRMKNTSSLFILSQRDPQAFEQGLKRMEDYISTHPNDEWLITDRITLTRGKKP